MLCSIRYTPFHQHLAKSLALSNLDNHNILLDSIPTYMKNRLQKVQNAPAGFVFNIYGKIKDVLELKS